MFKICLFTLYVNLIFMLSFQFLASSCCYRALSFRSDIQILTRGVFRSVLGGVFYPTTHFNSVWFLKAHVWSPQKKSLNCAFEKAQKPCFYMLFKEKEMHFDQKIHFYKFYRILFDICFFAASTFFTQLFSHRNSKSQP